MLDRIYAQIARKMICFWLNTLYKLPKLHPLLQLESESRALAGEFINIYTHFDTILQ